MIFYDGAKSSVDVEKYLCEVLSHYAREISELKSNPMHDHNDNIYQITITVEQIEPKL